MTTSDIHYVGTWSASGLPSGGNHADYYLRIAGGTVGNVLVNNGGTWSEVAIDITHMSRRRAGAGLWRAGFQHG